MATRSEKAAAVVGAVVAIASLGILLYKAAAPLLAEYDASEIGLIAGAVIVVVAGAAYGSARLRHRQIARRIKRK